MAIIQWQTGSSTANAATTPASQPTRKIVAAVATMCVSEFQMQFDIRNFLHPVLHFLYIFVPRASV